MAKFNYPTDVGVFFGISDAFKVWPYLNKWHGINKELLNSCFYFDNYF